MDTIARRIGGTKMTSETEKTDIATQLVDDREVTDAEGDRFRHADLVAQLADLAADAPTPSSVALFAPWGSGKSSIFNLLDEELRVRKSSCRLVRYDAFRYAKLPLQRHFIRSLAQALDVDSDDLDDGLYEGQQSNSIRFGSAESDKKTWTLLLQLLMFLVALVACAALLAVAVLAALAGLTVWFSDTEATSGFGTVFFDLAKGNLVGFLAPAGLLALVAGVANRSLWVTRQRAAPTSEEEFGAAFEKLVDSALSSRRHDRLIVFVDELDRCTAETVVETLDSLRTFLGAPHCVVIVAADQSALENALTRRSNVPTPIANPNPYYSSGSEYLDKTFHYQLHVPPLLPRRLSGFAAGLVRSKPGVWSRVESVDHVVSVLIPNHVRSPRRAKTLLNSFAMSYNLAERRAAADHISSDLPRRATELAFLTCIRVEFPLLASQLREHPDLVAALRQAIGIIDETRSFDADTVAVAHRFLSGTEITSAESALEPQDVEPDDEADEGVTTDAVISGEEPDAPDPVDLGGTTSPARAVARAQARQLELYLRKTARVAIPKQDLIHLEGTGARFGIDAALADSLDNAASQGDVDGVRQILERLDQDRYTGIEALAASLERDAAPLGEEARNLATVVLQVYAEESDRIPADIRSRVTNHCAAAVDAHLEAYQLGSEDLAGALALGLDSKSASGDRLANAVLGDARAIREPGVALVLLRRLEASSGIKLEADSAGSLIGAALAESDTFEDLARSLAAADASIADDVLQAAGPKIAAGLRGAVENDDEEAARVAATRRLSRCEALLDAFLYLQPARSELVERAAWIVLVSDTREARDAVAHRLNAIAPTSHVQSTPLSRALVSAATRRVVLAVPPLLEPVDPAHLASAEFDHLDEITLKVWKHRDKAEEFASEAQPTLAQVSRLLPAPLSSDSGAVATISGALGPAIDVSSLAAQREVDADLAAFMDAGVVKPEAIAEARATHLSAGLTTAIQPQLLTDGELQAYHQEAVAWAANLVAERSGLVEPVLASPWFPSPAKEELAIRSAASTASKATSSTPPLGVDTVAELIGVHGSAAAGAVTSWVRWFASDVAEARDLLRNLLDTGVRLEGDTRDDVSTYARTLDPSELWELLAPELHAVLARDPRVDLLNAARVRDLDPIQFSDHLVSMFHETTNNEQRARILELWGLHRPSDDNTRVRLIESVLFPLVDENAGAFDLALRRTDLWTNPPRQVSEELRRRLDRAANARNKVDAANRKMAEAGLKRRRRGLLGSSYEDA